MELFSKAFDINGAKAAEAAGKQALEEYVARGLRDNKESVRQIANMGLLAPFTKFIMESLGPNMRTAGGSILAAFVEEHNFIPYPWRMGVAPIIRGLVQAADDVFDDDTLTEEERSARINQHWDDSLREFESGVNAEWCTGRNPDHNVHNASVNCGAPDHHREIAATPSEIVRRFGSSHAFCVRCFPEMRGVSVETPSAPIMDIPAKKTLFSEADPEHANALAVLDAIMALHDADVLTVRSGYRRVFQEADQAVVRDPEVLKFLPKISNDRRERFAQDAIALRSAQIEGNDLPTEALQRARELQFEFDQYLSIASRGGREYVSTVREGFARARDAFDDSFNDNEREFVNSVRRRVLSREFWETGGRTVWDWFVWAFWTMSGRWFLGVYLVAGPIHIISLLFILVITSSIAGETTLAGNIFIQFLNCGIFLTALAMFLPRLLVPLYDRVIKAVTRIFNGAKDISLPDTMAGRWAMQMLGMMQERDLINRNVQISTSAAYDDNDRVGRITHATIIIDLIGCVSVIFVQCLVMSVVGFNLANTVIMSFALIAITAEIGRITSHHFNASDKKARADRLNRILEFALVLLLGTFFGSIAVLFVSQMMGVTSPIWILVLFVMILSIVGGLAVILIPPSRAKDHSDKRTWTEKLGVTWKGLAAATVAATLIFGVLTLADQHYYKGGIQLPTWTSAHAATAISGEPTGKELRDKSLCELWKDDPVKPKGCE